MIITRTTIPYHQVLKPADRSEYKYIYSFDCDSYAMIKMIIKIIIINLQVS